MAFHPGRWLARLSSKGPGRGLRCRGAVQHMAYECPGLHGKGSRQDIRRVTFARLLGEDDCRMVVPYIAVPEGLLMGVRRVPAHSQLP